MSRIRGTLAACTSLLLVLAGPPPAYADSVTPVRGFDTTGKAYFPWFFGCDLSPVTSGVAQPVVEATMPTPFLGTRSWGFQPAQAGQFTGWGVFAQTLSELDTLRVAVHGADTGTGYAQVLVTPTDTPPDLVWVGAASVGGTGDSWSVVDASDLTYGWTLYHRESLTKIPFDAPPATLGAFVGAHGGTTTGYTAAIGFGCTGQRFHYDAFSWGPPGGVTTLDFEAMTSTLTAGPGSTITAGRSATVTGSTTARTAGGTPVDLQARPYGASTWTTLTTVTAPASDDEAWPLRLAVSPLRRTDYRWHLSGSEIFQERYSPVVRVQVRTALTATIVDPTLRRGQALVVTGRTRPAKPGVTVTLRRRTSTGSVALATTRVRADGTYRVTHRVGRRGTWTVWTTVAAASGNLAGRSVNRSATVR